MRIAERFNARRHEGHSTCRSSRCPKARPSTPTSLSVAREGLDERLAEQRRRKARGASRAPPRVYRERLEREIEIIKSMGFPGYFLVVWDFIRYASERGIPVGPGRGSAAGSLVAYSLGITDIDPLAVRPALRALPQPRAHLACPTSTSTSA